MSRHIFLKLISAAALALCVAAAPAFSQEAATAPAAAVQPAQKIKVDGLPNLGQVAPNLYRGAQPKEKGYAELKNLGVTIVVNFREIKEAEKTERSRVEAQGMKYIEIPWDAFDKPDNNQVAQFLQLVRENPSQKIFIHCRRGAERTGVMAAAYRMSHDRWTPEQALHEMEEFNFRGLFFRNLKKYVRSFPEQMQADPALRPFRPR